MTASKSKTIAFRTSNKEYEEIKKISVKYSVPDSQIIRWALDAIINYEKTSGEIKLPLNFDFINQAIKKLSATTGREISSFDELIFLVEILLSQSTGKHIIPATKGLNDENRQNSWLVSISNPYTNEQEQYSANSLEEAKEMMNSPVMSSNMYDSELNDSIRNFVDGDPKINLSVLVEKWGEYVIQKALQDMLAGKARYGSKQEAIENITPMPNKKANIMAAAGSGIQAEIVDWDGTSPELNVRICGLSMLGTFNDDDVVTFKSKNASRSPYMKKGLIYLIEYDGKMMIKEYNTRKPTADEAGADYIQNGTVKILKSHNPDKSQFPDIIITQEVEWFAWYAEAN